MEPKLKFFLLIVFCIFVNSCFGLETVEVKCGYGNLELDYEEGLSFYSCKMQNDFPYLFLTRNLEVNKTDEGNHLVDKTDVSVNALQIASKNIFQIPDLTEIFSGITCIKIFGAEKLRYLVKENIGVYKETLAHLIITNSGLEIIDGTIFEGMTVLRTLDLKFNNIFYFESETIRYLSLLTFNLAGNGCLNDQNMAEIGNYNAVTPTILTLIIATLKYSSCKSPASKALLDRYKETVANLDSKSHNALIDAEEQLSLNAKEIADFTEKLAESNNNTAICNRNLEIANLNVSGLTTELETARGSIRELELELQTVKNRTGTLNDDLVILNDTLNSIKSVLSQSNQKITELQFELESVNSTVDSYKSKADSYAKRIEEMKKEAAVQEEKFQVLESKTEHCFDVNGTCRFTNGTYGYSCIAHNIKIDTAGQTVDWTGTHTLSTQSNNNVNALIIKDLKVEYIPSKIGNTFSKLRIFIMQKCGLKKLSKGDFEGMNFVRSVVVSSNNISSVGSDAFNDLWSLEALDLSQNNIKSFPSKIFAELIYLMSLKLDENQLTALRADSLATSNSVKYFSATNNSLSNVESSFVWKLRGANFIDFTGNYCNVIFNLTAGDAFINLYSYVLSRC